MLLNEKYKDSIFNNSIYFKFPWRKYQAKFLENFQKHKSDNHLHVIAPPGAGKTVLGLEMVRRINKKTLLFAPTLTIKNQWKNRFQELFDSKSNFSEISTEIKHLKSLNFTTYQAIFSLRADFDSTDSFVDYFKKNGIEVLVFDEAHHLKRAWWKVLMELKSNSFFTIIALTATPPFDSSNLEMKRYFDLCGEVDEEITIPELVKEKALCPHQDYIYLSKPDKSEIEYIVNYRKRIASFIQFLKENSNFLLLLKEHAFYKNTKEHIQEIYNDPAYFSSILVFLHHCGEEISAEKLIIFGFDESETIEFPALTIEWVEILLQKLLFDYRDTNIGFTDVLHLVEVDLRKIGGIHQKKVNLISIESVFKKLTNSSSKLNSIVEITKFEEANFKQDLRLVILTDFIRKEFLGLHENYTTQINKVGVVPIFHYLKMKLKDVSKIAVLSGTLVIVHENCLSSLKKYFEIHPHQIKPVENANHFVQLVPNGASSNKIVQAITEIFEKGIITVLIGTKSLLGEGWDAPSINSLILASNVGSFVSSNQMRGRAIRVQKANKTGHIWHLASIDVTDVSGGKDIEQLKQRFQSFVGLNSNSNTIESGIERLSIPEFFSDNFDVIEYNNKTFELAKNRDVLENQWRQAIAIGSSLKKVINFNYINQSIFNKNKKIYFTDMVKILFVEIGIGLSYLTFDFLLKNIRIILSGGLSSVIKFFIITLFTFFVPRTYKAIKYYFLFGNAYKLIEKISKTILKTMLELNLLETEINKVSLTVLKEGNGRVSCSLDGATYQENKLFIDALNEVLEPLENPRYLIQRDSWLKGKLGVFNVHAVPKLFELNKKTANLFFNNFKKHIGKSTLVYGRNEEGRKLILKARLFHLKYLLNNTSKNQVVWK